MKRFCYYIPADAYVEGQGFRASVVFENESGHCPTGDWPYTGEPGQKMPYFWGHDYEDAKQICIGENARMDIDEEGMLDIVASSMRASVPRRGTE